MITSVLFSCVQILSVHDGDTFTVNFPQMPFIFSHMSIRIAGIDAPELNSRRLCERNDAQLARTALITFLHGKCVTLMEINKDKFFRLLAKVSVDGVDAGDYLISQGLAVFYDGGKKSQWNCITK